MRGVDGQRQATAGPELAPRDPAGDRDFRRIRGLLLPAVDGQTGAVPARAAVGAPMRARDAAGGTLRVPGSLRGVRGAQADPGTRAIRRPVSGLERRSSESDKSNSSREKTRLPASSDLG